MRSTGASRIWNILSTDLKRWASRMMKDHDQHHEHADQEKDPPAGFTLVALIVTMQENNECGQNMHQFASLGGAVFKVKCYPYSSR